MLEVTESWQHLTSDLESLFCIFVVHALTFEFLDSAFHFWYRSTLAFQGQGQGQGHDSNAEACKNSRTTDQLDRNEC